ncbi:SDR family oxidoreductase [soil metagenome]
MTNKLQWYLVSGASNGIGFETALHLSKIEGIGVISIARNLERLNQLKSIAGPHLIIKQYDLLKNDPLTFSKFFQEHGIEQLHGIVNNAGQLINKPFSEMRLSDLESTYQVNVFAPYLLIQELLPFLTAANGAHVVNISSMGGIQGISKFPGLSAYSSSKGALCTLTECLALELVAQKISVNCLALGAVQTEMLSAAFPGYKAPLEPAQMAEFISWFTLKGQTFFNGKILPVALSNP